MIRAILLILVFSVSRAQVPDTDLWLFELKKEKEQFMIKSGNNITSRQGYDNQPVFSSDGKGIYYVSIREDKQADVYFYSVKKKNSVQVTKTVESEYSPTPDGSNKSMTCVVVEKDSAQRIWKYEIGTGSPLSFIIPEDSVGYFTFLNNDTVLYYKLSEPHSLRMRSVTNGKDEFIAASVCRGFKAISRHEFIFGVKEKDAVRVYRFDVNLKRAVFYATWQGNAEDLIWHEIWGLLRSDGSHILRYDAGQNTWINLFDLGSYGIKLITRFAFDSQNRRLVIAENKGH